MPKYEIIDDSDNSIGFVVIKAEQVKEFQSVASQAHSQGVLSARGPIAEASLFLVVGGSLMGAVVFVDGPGWLAAAVGIGGGLLVASLRAWRSGLPVEFAAGGDVTRIEVEQVSSDGKHWVMNEFDGSISFAELQAVAKAVCDEGYQWSRAVTTKAGKISQPKHRKMQADLVKLWYVEPLPNSAKGYQVTRQGRRFFEAVSSLPSV